VLKGEDDSEYERLELVCLELEVPSRAMLDDVLDQLEETLSELRERNHIVLDHLEGALDEAIQDLLQEA